LIKGAEKSARNKDKNPMKTDPVEEACARALLTLAVRPAALISDIDGAISPIVKAPQEAYVLDACRDALRRLAEQLDLVAILSGRQVDNARQMVGLDELLYFGNHGLERWSSRLGYRSEAEAYEGAMERLRRLMAKEVEHLPGIHVEDKRVVISLHYRNSPAPDAAREALLNIVQPLAASGLIIREGKMVIEIRPPVQVDKGSVVATLVREYSLRGIVFVGDDLTDIDAMHALRRLSRETGLAVLSIGVGGNEAPAGMRAAADIVLPEPEAVASFLSCLSSRL